MIDHILSCESLREKYLIDREDRYDALLRGRQVVTAYLSVLRIPDHRRASVFRLLCTLGVDTTSPLYDAYVDGGLLFLLNYDGDIRASLGLARNQSREWGTIRELIRKDVRPTSSDSYRFFRSIPRSRLLSESVWNAIVPILPKSLQGHSPSLLYTSSEDGYRIMHLLRHAKDSKPTLLLMEAKDVLLGVYREDAWTNRRDGFGLSSTILFRRRERLDSWKGVPSPEGQPRYVYVRSTDESIIIGGGGREGMSLFIPSDFLNSCSQKSEVFGNDPLMDTEFFSIVNMELFSF